MNKTDNKLQRFRIRIEQKANDRSRAPVLIVCLGDSVTMGATSFQTFDYEMVYHSQLKRLLEKQYPSTVFSVINAGVAGETAADGLKRVDRDVVAHHPDLVVIGFGLNDVRKGRSGLQEFHANMSRIVCAVKERTEADVVLLTPNYMVTKANPNVHMSQQKLVSELMRLQNENILKEYSARVREVAETFRAGCVDVYSIWDTLRREGVDVNKLLANGLNHPNAHGHKIAAHEIMKLICPEFEVNKTDE